jgi:hypothetical protein
VDAVRYTTRNVGLAEMEVYGTVDDGSGNSAPTADAGGDFAVNQGDVVELDGSGSFDADGDVLSYQWTQTGGVAVNLRGADGAQPSFTAPDGLSQDAVLAFRLVVNDGRVASLPDEVRITVVGSGGGDGTPASDISSLARVTASSQNTSTRQLAVKAVDGVVDGYPGDSTREWATLGEKAGAWIQLEWADAYTVDRVVLYDRPNLNDQITGATLRFSDGTSVSIGALDNAGGSVVVEFAARQTRYVRLTVDAVRYTTRNVGLAEMEVYGAM